ncbi:RNase P subunit p30-domain-containing protein [Calycina marina]|uniref:RNase P subunit p30-domain-containing protein n=1 Tax=Calycina marina TaxID=1763456 RepID=A0A9P7YXF8_9HELO|nr:RNase P subunit p30-domain-containing protein [Calycina marina]
MLYDLNIPWTCSTDPLELQRTISFLSSLGYDTIALNHIMSTVPSQIVNPIPSPLPFTIPPNTTILRRCTLQIEDPSLNYRLPALAAAYDVLALRPKNEKGYDAACVSLLEHSIISLDLTQRFPFYFRPKKLMAAINRGCKIELCYSQAVMGDAAERRHFISNTLEIMRATKGRGLLISSEATSVLGVRAPADVVNLFSVWGLSRDRGMEGISINARGVVVNEGLKRSSYRGVVDVIYGGEPRALEPAESNKKKAIEGQKKRKADDTGEITSQPSKRAQKKAKHAAKQAGIGNGMSQKTTPGDSTPVEGIPSLVVTKDNTLIPTINTNG